MQLPVQHPDKNDVRLDTPTQEFDHRGGTPWEQLDIEDIDDHYESTLMDLRRLLYQFGHRKFTDHQLRSVLAAVEGRHVGLFTPTNSGKSIAFQVPAIYQDGARRGVTIVIEPTISLINDQVEKLERHGFAVMRFHSEVPNETKHSYISFLQQGGLVPLIYVTPDWLDQLIRLVEKFRAANVLARFVFDEAHLLYQWGDKDQFRELAYEHVKKFACKFPGTPWTIVTASMTKDNVKRLSADLRIPYNSLTLSEPFMTRDRPNLIYSVLEAPDGILPEILKKLTENPEKCTIIFCSYRSQCHGIRKFLMGKGIDAAVHTSSRGGVIPTELQRWVNGECKVIVATSALGHGIDKQDVRMILHYDIPGSLEQLLQETGRAGRDGKEAICNIYFRLGSIQRRIQLITDDASGSSVSESKLDDLRQVVKFCSDQFKCRRLTLLAPFDSESSLNKNCAKCDTCFSRCDPFSGGMERIRIDSVAQYALKLLKGFREKPTNRDLSYFFVRKSPGITTKKFISGMSETMKCNITNKLLNQLVITMFQEGVLDIRASKEGCGPKDGALFLAEPGPQANRLLENKLPIFMDVPKSQAKILTQFIARDL